eukprot:2153904-Amphidinium_carterae.6
MPSNMSETIQGRATSMSSVSGSSEVLTLLAQELQDTPLVVGSSNLTADAEPLLFLQELPVGEDGKPLGAWFRSSTSRPPIDNAGPTSSGALAKAITLVMLSRFV